jgi:hypothetical protein
MYDDYAYQPNDELEYNYMKPQTYAFTYVRSYFFAWGEDHRHEPLAICVCSHDINTCVEEAYVSILGSNMFGYLVLR